MPPAASSGMKGAVEKSEKADVGTAAADSQNEQRSHVERVLTCASSELSRQLGSAMPPGLYLVATPIGNLGDITIRALAALARADVIYCEDTRHSRTLASHYGLTAPLRPYHEHNGEEQRPHILRALAGGQRVALISDAGTPLISDPGFKLAREVAAEGHAVFALPGPSALLSALLPSGLPTDAFFFGGFLPNRSAARRARLEELMTVPGTLVFFEAPSRLAEMLADCRAVLGGRPAAVARELTKLHEETVRGDLGALAAWADARDMKGEIVVVIGPPQAREVTQDDIGKALAKALETMKLRDAARAVADALGVPKGRVYDLGLALKRDGGDAGGS